MRGGVVWRQSRTGFTSNASLGSNSIDRATAGFSIYGGSNAVARLRLSSVNRLRKFGGSIQNWKSPPLTEINPMDENLPRSKQKKALDTMASGIAHELNNILYPILIYTKLHLNKAEVGGEEYVDLSEILDCAHRGEDLISKIHTYCGHIESTKKVSDLVPIIIAAMKSLRTAKPATIEFKEQICGNKMPATCDAAQILQVLTNLCTNAVQAIADIGEINITLESMTLEGFECLDGTILSGEHARLVVTDNGAGMSEATLARIFDPFFTTHSQATGLGLSTVIGIVRSHNGGICVSSKPGIGTTFEIFLPLAQGNLEELPE